MPPPLHDSLGLRHHKAMDLAMNLIVYARSSFPLPLAEYYRLRQSKRRYYTRHCRSYIKTLNENIAHNALLYTASTITLHYIALHYIKSYLKWPKGKGNFKDHYGEAVKRQCLDTIAGKKWPPVKVITFRV